MDHEYCRLCLAENDLNCINDQVKTIIYNELKIDIEKHKDLLSIEICVTCREFLTKINIFKTKVLKNQSLLNKIVNIKEENNIEPKRQKKDEVSKPTFNQKQSDATDRKKQSDNVVVQASVSLIETKVKKEPNTENEEVTSNKSKSRRSETNNIFAEVVNNSHVAAINWNDTPLARIKSERIPEAGNIATSEEVTSLNDPSMLVDIKTEPGTANHPCKVCAKSFYSEGSLNIHHRRRHRNVFLCRYCQYFSNFETKRMHVKTRRCKTFQFRCPKRCGKRFEEFYSMETHFEKCSGGTIYKCMHCRRTMRNLRTLKKHFEKCQSISLSATDTSESSDTDTNEAPLPDETKLELDKCTKKSRNSAMKSTNAEQISIEPHHQASSSTESSCKRSIQAKENLKIKRTRFSPIDELVPFEKPPTSFVDSILNKAATSNYNHRPNFRFEDVPKTNHRLLHEPRYITRTTTVPPLGLPPRARVYNPHHRMNSSFRENKHQNQQNNIFCIPRATE